MSRRPRQSRPPYDTHVISLRPPGPISTRRACARVGAHADGCGATRPKPCAVRS
jgi:hypothetical protein